MHFWIDKRSQCTYTGRHRVPSSLSAGAGRGRVGRKGMAAPVHRFAALDPPPRRPPRHRPHSSAPAPVHGGGGVNGASTANGAIANGRRPGPQSLAAVAAARSVTPDTLLRSAALGLHAPVMAPHLKFGMLVSFVLATMFLAGAKYYFDSQLMRAGGGNTSVTGGAEVGAVCACAVALAGVGCALNMCRDRHSPAPPDRVSSTGTRHLQQAREEPEAVSTSSLLSEAGQSPEGIVCEAPPPYHVAVLLPASAPPAYHALPLS